MSNLLKIYVDSIKKSTHLKVSCLKAVKLEFSNRFETYKRAFKGF